MAQRRQRRSSRSIISIDSFLSDDDEEVSFDVTEYPVEEEEEESAASPSASETASAQNLPGTGEQDEVEDQEEVDDDDGSEEEEEEEEACSRKWPLLERSSSNGDNGGPERLSERLVRGAERRSRERPSNCSAIDDPLADLEEVQLFAPESLDEGFTLPLQRDETEGQQLRAWARPRVRADASSQLALDELLRRRHTAGALLSGRRHASGGLPAIPDDAVALVLRLSLPLDDALACFSLRAGVPNMDEAFKAQTLQLQSCELGPDTAEVLGWLLRHNRELRELDVSHNPLGPHGAASVGRGLARAPQLHALRLNHCQLLGADGAGLDELATVGVAGHPALQTLELAGNAIGANGGLGVRALVGALSDPRGSLTHLNLGSNALQPTGCAALAGVLLAAASTSPTPPTLRRLNLSANQITGGWGKCLDGVRALAMALACNSTLEELDLSANAIGCHLSESAALWLWQPTSALLLARALTYNSTLADLDLRANHIVGSHEEQLRAAWAGYERRGPLRL